MTESCWDMDPDKKTTLYSYKHMFLSPYWKPGQPSCGPGLQAATPGKRQASCIRGNPVCCTFLLQVLMGGAHVKTKRRTNKLSLILLLIAVHYDLLHHTGLDRITLSLKIKMNNPTNMKRLPSS